jgi:hypothetical protein
MVLGVTTTAVVSADSMNMLLKNEMDAMFYRIAR